MNERVGASGDKLPGLGVMKDTELEKLREFEVKLS